METTLYRLGTRNPEIANKYYDILKTYGVVNWNHNGDPVIVEAREKRVWFVDDWKTYYTFKAEIYKRDVKIVRRLVKNTGYPSSYISDLRNIKEPEYGQKRVD